MSSGSRISHPNTCGFNRNPGYPGSGWNEDCQQPTMGGTHRVPLAGQAPAALTRVSSPLILTAPLPLSLAAVTGRVGSPQPAMLQFSADTSWVPCNLTHL